MSISTLATSGSHSVDKLLGNAFLIVKEVQENLDMLRAVALLGNGGVNGLGEIVDRMLVVPPGELAPVINDRNSLKGKVLGVSADGSRIVGIGWNGSSAPISTPVIVHEGTNLDEVIGDLFGRINVERERLTLLLAEMSALADDVVDGATTTTGIESRLSQLVLDLESFSDVVTDINALQNNQLGLSTLIINERAERIFGDTATAATLQLIGAKNGANDAFILDLDRVKVSPTESFAARFSAIKADTDNTIALIQQEVAARANASLAEVTAREQLGAQIRSEFGYTLSSAILDEQTVRATADTAEATARQVLAVTLRNEIAGGGAGDFSAAITTEQNARIDGDQAQATAREALAVTLRNETDMLIGAAVSAEATVRLSNDTAEANARQALGVVLQGNINNQSTVLTALVTTEQNARVTADAAEAARVQLLSSRVGTTEGAIINGESARVSADGVLTTQINALTSRTTSAEASISNEAAARASGDLATALASTTLIAGLVGDSLLSNPKFTNYPNATGVPPGCINYAGTDITYRSAGANGVGHSVSWDAAPGTLKGVCALPGSANPGLSSMRPAYMVLELDLKIRNGGLKGLYAFVQGKNAASATVQAFYLYTWIDTDNQTGSPLGDGQIDRVYNFKKLCAFTHPQIVSYEIYILSDHTYDPGEGKHPTIYKLNLRTASPAEIRDQTVLLPMQATVATNSNAIVTQASSIATLNTTVATQGSSISANTTAITTVNSSLASTNTSLSTLGATVSSQATAITTNATNISGVSSSLASTNSTVSALGATVSTQATAVNTNTSAIGNVSSNVASLTTTVSAQGSAISNNSTAISTVNSGLASTNTTLSTLGATVSTQATAITSNTNAIGSTNSSVASLTSTVSTLNASVTTQSTAIFQILHIFNHFACGR